MSNSTTTVRYEFRKCEAPLFLKPSWVRIENTVTEQGIIIESITRVEKPEEAPKAPLGQLAFSF